MGDSTLAVIVGLATGVAFIVTFGIFFNNTMIGSNEIDGTMNIGNSSTPKTAVIENITNILARFEGFDADESTELDMSHLERNEPEAIAQAERIGEVTSLCERHSFHIWYGLGSMRAAIEGVEGGNETLCSIFIFYEIEMGENWLDCSVPLEVMPTWQSWNNRLVPEIREISDYCTRINA